MTLASPMSAATTLRVGDDRYVARPWLRDELADPLHWRTLDRHGWWDFDRDAGASGGSITGEWLSDSPSLFFDRKLGGDYVWQVRVTRLATDEAFLRRFRANKHAQDAEPEHKHNFNFWLRVDAPGGAGVVSGKGHRTQTCGTAASAVDWAVFSPSDEGEKDLRLRTAELTAEAAVPQAESGRRPPEPVRGVPPDFFTAYPTKLGTGWNGMGDDYWNSLFQTIVWNPDSNWTRLRRSPGYTAVRDVSGVVPFMPYDEPRTFTFALSPSRGLVRMYVDDRRVYEYESGELPAAGYLGLCVWLCSVRFDQMRLYQWR